MRVPETILVVDDDPDIARFVEVNLRSAGYDVAVAGDGEEALDKASEIRPDLVLLDVMMPRIDGFEVAQRLRRSPQTANTSIIMLTAKALSADKVTGLQSGADDYIIKPFDPIELLARVKGTLRRAKEMRNLSPLTGLVGTVAYGEIDFNRGPIGRHTSESEFSLDGVTALPRVDIIMAHENMDGALIDGAVAAGAKGLVIAGVGNGNLTAPALTALATHAKAGVVCVRSTRVTTGRVGRNVEVDDDKAGFVASLDHNPQKARVLLRLALLKSRTTADLQRLFSEY